MTHNKELCEFLAETRRTLTDSELDNVSGGEWEQTCIVAKGEFRAIDTWYHLLGQYKVPAY